LSVADTGTGIPHEDLPRIFERFFRSDKSRHRADGRRGTGLGLSICQAIVTALGGAISVESTPGQGSRFTVTLPTYPEIDVAESEALAAEKLSAY
jgi:two-component system OmpR family sensor kinase